MLIGLKRVDITPDVPLPMGGNAHADSIARTVHDPLYANIIVLQGEKERVVLIEVDLLGVTETFSLRIKEAAAVAAGIQPEAVLLNAIHTHSAPDVTLLTQEILDYAGAIAQAIGNGVREACGSLFEGRIGFGSAFIRDVSFVRRIWMKDGSLHMNWEQLPVEEIAGTDGEIDPEISIMKLEDTSGKLRGILVNFALHPAILVGYGNAYSRDWIWGLDEELRKRWGDDVLVYFANGAEGNINHIDLWNPNQGRDFDEAYRIGKAVADQVSGALPGITAADTNDLRMAFREASIDRRPLTPEVEAWADELAERCGGVIPDQLDGLPDEFYAMNYQKYKLMAEYINVELQVLRIGEALFYTIPGEGFCQMGQRLKRKTPGRPCFVIGLANNSAGYIPTLEAFDNGGYEIRMATSSQFGVTAAYEITERLLRLSEKVR